MERTPSTAPTIARLAQAAQVADLVAERAQQLADELDAIDQGTRELDPVRMAQMRRNLARSLRAYATAREP